jgi:anaerobic selenocysteine-containing dehydrogenase
MRVSVRDGVAVKVAGDPHHAYTGGVLCTKVSRYLERVYHPERVLYPLKRVGLKGAGEFVRVSWDEALREIAQRLQAITALDPQAVLPYSYAGTMGWLQGESMSARFFNRLGASQLDRTICSTAGSEALDATYGARLGMHVQHFAHSRLILIWGSNSITSNLHFWSVAQEAKRHGAKLIAIDPRRSETAEKCHEHIALLPGTDGALALGLMHELIQNNWLDEDYIAQHVDAAWPRLRERALQWPPERVAQVCGISADEVKSLARDYGTLAPAAIRLNYGMQRVRGAGNAVRLIALLPCLVGAWRQASGGLLMSASGWAQPFKNTAALQRPDLRTQRARTINMSTIGKDLLREASADFGPKIEALIVYNSNPVAVAPESTQVVQGFAREDLFTVVLEHFLTDTADHADFVLPATMQLEHLDVHSSYGHTDLLINNPAIAQQGEAKPNTQIFRELAAHMGFSEACFQDSDEDLARAALSAPQGPNFDELRARSWLALPVPDAPFAHGGFKTADGRCIIDHPDWGVPDFIPNYESAQAAPELAQRYPLAMISPPARHFLNSSFVNVESLRAAEKQPLLEINAADAAARGIADGATVRVFNDRGDYRCMARISPRARTGVVCGLGVWWRKFNADGKNVNELTHQHLTDIGRAPAFYDCLVQVELLKSKVSRQQFAATPSP